MIEYPYLPKGKIFSFAPESSPYMRRAKEMADKVHAQFPWAKWITASVVVKEGEVLAHAVNENVHFSFCPRRIFNSASGEDYEFCPRHCHPKNHSEARAIKEAGARAKGADLYMYGHWWCCKPCWDRMEEVGIKDVFLVEGAADKFSYDAATRKVESPRAWRYDGNISQELESLLSKVNVIKNQLSATKPDFILTYLNSNSYAVNDKIIVFDSSRDFISQLSQALED